MEFALSVNQEVNSVGTTPKALATANTAVQVELQLGTEIQGLWIVTPEATQVTPLEKDGCADTRTIVDREALDVRHNTSLHLITS